MRSWVRKVSPRDEVLSQPIWSTMNTKTTEHRDQSITIWKRWHKDLSRGSRACRHASPRCVSLHHMVRWLIGLTPSLSKTPQEPTKWQNIVNDTSNPLMLPLTIHRGRHKPLTITGGGQEQSPISCQHLQAAPSRLGSGNHQEKQEFRSKSTTKCQLNAIWQCKCTWITQSHFEYAKK
jgi:hypothetical protein